MMNRSTATKVLIGMSLGALALASWAAETDKPGGDIKDVFRAFLRQGKTASGSALSILGPDILFVGDLTGSVPYAEQIPTPGGISIQTSLPITGSPERPQRDLSELLEKVREACGLADGAVVHRDMPDGMPAINTPQVVRGFNAVQKDGLAGQFWCQNPSGEALFMVEVRPASSARVPLIPIGWDWNIAMRFATRSVLQKYQSRLVGYEKAVADLRSKASVGDAVQVLSTELPAQVMQQWGLKPGRGPVEVCGLVVDVKPPLAKIQIGATEQWFEVSKLLPQGGEKKGAQEIDVFSQLQPQSWCLH